MSETNNDCVACASSWNTCTVVLELHDCNIFENK